MHAAGRELVTGEHLRPGSMCYIHAVRVAERPVGPWLEQSSLLGGARANTKHAPAQLAALLSHWVLPCGGSSNAFLLASGDCNT